MRTDVQASRPANSRSQWELDSETARVKAQVDAEERERQRQYDVMRRKQIKADEEAARQTKRLLDAEDKERRRRQTEVDRETERLRRQFGTQSSLMVSPVPQQRHSSPMLPGRFRQPQQPPAPHAIAPPTAGPYLQPHVGARPPPAAVSSATFFSSGPPHPQQHMQPQPQPQPKLRSGKKSFWGLRSAGESQKPANNLRKKHSSMF